MTRAALVLALLLGLAPGYAGAASIDLSHLAVVGDSLAVGVGSGNPSEPVRRTSYAARLAAQAGSRLESAAVSGARVEDALAQASVVASNAPTVVVVWIGSNDALFAALSADPSRLTPPARFDRAFREAVRRISGTGATLVVATVPDVTRTPRAAGLSAAQAAAIRNRVALFNRAIADTARAAGALLVDIHGLLEAAHREGVRVGLRLLTTRADGGLFSPDGFHPSATGQAILANAFIDAINARFGTAVPPVDVADVAAKDPMVR